MKRFIILASFLLAGICLSEAKAETAFNPNDVKSVSVTRADGGFIGTIWHFFHDGYSTVTEKFDSKTGHLSIDCTGGGSHPCPNPLKNLTVPDGINPRIYFDRDAEVGSHLANGEAEGTIKTNISTPNGKKYLFITDWKAVNSRNNVINSNLIELPSNP